jgi:hypothetical protein
MSIDWPSLMTMLPGVQSELVCPTVLPHDRKNPGGQRADPFTRDRRA